MTGARAWLAAAVVAAAAFFLYDATLLPGQDLGDTASFQATIGSSNITPRQAYPLYYATGNLFVRALPGHEPAYAINLASAVFGALACGLLVIVVARLTGHTLAGVFAGLLLAASYTFWSQAIIAEVYALHCFMMGLCFVALLWWAARPASMGRLALFFALYAAGFGNHLMMILLLPGFAVFLALTAPGGIRWLLSPRVVLLAVAMAALGASQYLWNFSYLLHVYPRPGMTELVRDFWFDVTKSDWRATMVMGIPEGALRNRIGMWWFDLRQQFGLGGIALAAVGMVSLFMPARLPAPLDRLPRARVGAAMLVLFLVCWAWAFTYNVGDVHVFYLPAHFIAALLAGVGVGGLITLATRYGAQRRVGPLALGFVLLLLPAWRAYDTYPALDRSHDWQVKNFFDRLTAGLTGLNSVLASDLNWQLHNGMDYYDTYTRPELAVLDTTEALLYFPLVVESNREIDRPFAVTAGARSMLLDAYGPLFPLQRDQRVQAMPLTDRLARFAPGTAYVLTVLSGYPDMPIDTAECQRALDLLSGGTVRIPQSARYSVIAGRIGSKPTLVRSDVRPFRLTGSAGGVNVEVRMECWLPADTIRRMGFGRVIVGRDPALTIDRGVSFVALTGDGSPAAVEYGWAILAPQPRWIIPVADQRHGQPERAAGLR